MPSNPFDKAASTRVPLPRRREIRPMDQARRASPQEQSHLMINIPNQNVDQSIMGFSDPAEVQQWVATSAKGSTYPANPCVSLPQVGHPGVLENVSGHCSTLQGSNPISQNVPLPFPYGPGVHDQCFNVDTLAMDSYPTLATESPFGSDSPITHEFAYDVPGSVDMVYTTSGSSNLFMNEFYGGNGAMKDMGPMQQDAALFQNGFYNPTAWSSPSTESLEPSLSSSYSQGSLFPGQENSPTSYATEDSSSNISIQDDAFLPPSLVDLSGQTSFTCGPNEEMHFDVASTMRASSGFPRAPLMENAFWSPQSPAEVMMTGLPLDMYIARRSSSEHDNSSARRNQLYHLGPKEDGLYHCPFEVSEGCKHKPEKLKCNYDKHLDSHLKPYRCKVPACGSVPFSSTACLLRHEREAHGMHGHGDRPYMCSYPDCDRSLQGNGFPRRWNLMDHMKRVHDHQAMTTDPSSPTPSDYAKASRRRRTSTSSQASGSRISKSNAKNAMTLKQKSYQKQGSSH